MKEKMRLYEAAREARLELAMAGLSGTSGSQDGDANRNGGGDTKSVEMQDVKG
jgi:hypothetical protein